VNNLRRQTGLLRLTPVAVLLLRITEAGGDPGVFCYRMGVDILAASRGRFLVAVPSIAFPSRFNLTESLARRIRNQAACSNLLSISSARSSTLKD
jgi:hypothetical protein